MAVTSYHFIGIGGIGMSGLAELLVRQGHRVSGSDLAANAITQRLQTLGVAVYEGHRPENLDDAQVVVYSSAVREDNPELALARVQGREVLRRGQMLACLMQGHCQIAITGAHGKTSTTAMVAAVLRAGGLDPSVLVGALWDNLGSNAVLGRGDYFVAEADESDGSFLYLTPQVSVLTNLDREHLDYYRDLAHIQETFARYLAQHSPQAQIVAWRDDPHLWPLLQNLPQQVMTYSLGPGADLWATDLRIEGLQSRYRLWHHGRQLGEITLPLTGSHYVLNSLAACSVALSLGLPFPTWQQGLQELKQIHRRCQVKGEAQGVMVVDDYGHHPTEIQSTIMALAQSFPDRRLMVAFQPHRYSRTKALLPEFFPVFNQAGMVFVTEIYSAGEPVLPELSGRQIYDGIRRQGHPSAYFVSEKTALPGVLMDHLRPGDVLLTLGAGDIWRIGEELLAQLGCQPVSPQMPRPPGERECHGARA